MAAIFYVNKLPKWLPLTINSNITMATLEALKCLIATLLVLAWQPFCNQLPW